MIVDYIMALNAYLTEEPEILSAELTLGIEHRQFFKKSVLKFVTKTFELPYTGDVYNLDGLLFEDVSPNFKFKSISLEIGPIKVFTLDKDMCKLFYQNKHKKFEQEFFTNGERVLLYNLPWDELKMTDVIKLVSLHYHKPKFILDCDGYCTNPMLLGHYTYYDDTMRGKIRQSIHEKIIHQIFSTSFTSYLYNDTINLPVSGIVNGLFFKNININNIKTLKIILNEKDFIELDTYTIRCFTKIVNEKLFYLPFDRNFDFNTINIAHGLNLGRIKDIKINIQYNNITNDRHDEFEIFCRAVNPFVIKSGLCTYHFNYD